MSFYLIEPNQSNPTTRDTSLVFSDESSINLNTADTDASRYVLNAESTSEGNIAPALEQTLFQALADGKESIVVGANYAGPAEIVATKTGADFEETDEGIKLTANENTQKRDNDTIRAALVAFNATQAGLSADEVMQKFKEIGFSDSEVEESLKRMNIVGQAVEAGMSIEDIEARMNELTTTIIAEHSEPPKIPWYAKMAAETAFKYTTKAATMTDVLDPDREMTPEQLVSSLKVLHPTLVSDSITTTAAFFGNRGAQQRYDQARLASRQKIIDTAQSKYGVNLVWQGEEVGSERWYVEQEEGLVEVTPGFFEDLKKVSGEIAGGITGALLGARAGASVGSAFGPWGTGAGAITGGAVGSWGGAIAGSQADYLYQAIKMNEDMEAEAMAYRALNAFEAAAIGEAIGYTAIKGLGVGWRGVVEAKNFVVNNEARRGYAALKEATGFSDAQVEEIVAAFERYAPLSGSKEQKGIAAVALSQPSMQPLVKAAGSSRQGVISNVKSGVQKRADSIMEEAARISDNHSPEQLVNDLKNYVSDVRDNYVNVKARATQSSRGQDFSFDFEKLAISPVLESLVTKITDPATKERFLLQMQRINGMSESRTFGDLIELRQITNDFLYNKRVVKADDRATIRGVLANIDEAIENGAPHVVDNPKQWLADWADVRKEYSSMKQVERTALYKAMFDTKGQLKPVKPETIVNALGKYVDALDGSFEDVMSKLPPKGRSLYESAILNRTLDKNKTMVEGIDVINFGKVAEDLSKISFTTKDSRAFKQAIIDMSEVFKNDPSMARLAPDVSLPGFKSYLTTDPRKRLEYGAASSIFGYISSKAPTETGRRYALVRSAAKVLENPLNFRAMKELTEEVFDDVNLTRQLLNLRQEAARSKAAGVDNIAARVKIYEGGKLKGTNAIASIPAHRIATLEQAKQIAEAEYMTLNSEALDMVLRKYGYEAILNSSDRVKLLRK